MTRTRNPHNHHLVLKDEPGKYHSSTRTRQSAIVGCEDRQGGKQAEHSLSRVEPRRLERIQTPPKNPHRIACVKE